MTTDEYFYKYADSPSDSEYEDYFVDKKNFKVALLEFAKEILQVAAERGYALVKDHDGYIAEYVNGDYSFNIDMSESSPLQYGCSVIFDKESILNLINELK
jgi:hypothetical protein